MSVSVVRGLRPVTGRARMALAGGLIVALIAVVVGSAGCGTGPSEAGAAQDTSSATTAVLPPDVWAAAGIGEAPLFDLVVTEAGGFTATECDYLRAERTAWNQIRYQAERYAGLSSSGDAAGAAEAIAKVQHKAAIAAAAPAPSSRFGPLRTSVAQLMGRVVRIARTLNRYDAAASDADRSAAADSLARTAAPLAKNVLHVGDWGVAVFCAYGGVKYPEPAATVAATATTTEAPETTTSASTATGGGSSSSGSGGGSEPQPNPDPGPSLNAAERRQLDELEQLDAWLMPVVQDSLALVGEEDLPWEDAEVESFSLNMGYVCDQCSLWLEKSPAGALMATGFKEYQKGLSLAKKGALRMQTAVQSNDSDHQKELEKAARTMQDAVAYLNGGLARLQRMK